MLDSRQTVANLVLDHSECAPVFQRHRIDFCCGGDVSIEGVARKQGINIGQLVDELSRAIAERTGKNEEDLRERSTPALIAHIVAKHHGYLRKSIPFVRPLAAKVSRIHGARNPKLRDLDVAVGELADILLPHLDEEEETLFPALVAKDPDLRLVARELKTMRADHDVVGKLLERLRSVSDDFQLPDWACNSYRTLFSELERLEGDVHMHVHLENHVLMPRFASA
jgi:regulator of cell morphogenesis and NO signaling